MKIVILSCGEGKRLSHLGYKPTLPFKGSSILEHILKSLKCLNLLDVIAFTRPESAEINKLFVAYDVKLQHRRTPNAFTTFREFSKTASDGEYYIVLNSDVVFNDSDFERFIKICKRQERDKGTSFIVWISRRSGVGIALDSGVREEGLCRISSIHSESPYSFADVIFLPGKLCTLSLCREYEEIEKVIFYLKAILNQGYAGYAYKGKAIDIDTEEDYKKAKDCF